MAVAYFNQEGVCICIDRERNSLIPHKTLPIVADVEPDVKTTDIYFDFIEVKPKFKKSFNVSILRGKILNIPQGTIASTLYGSYIVNDGDLEVEASIPGSKIKVALIHPHYKDKIVEVTSL